jgi:DNA-binding HxlR family transcriptional regulator
VSDHRWDVDLVPDEAGRTDRPEPSCPVEVALSAIAGRWTTLLLRDLMSGPRSFSEIRNALPTLSDKVLADRLRDLQARGLIERQVRTGFPTRTTYALTASGRRLRPLLVQLYETGRALQMPTPPGDQGTASR